jgi:sugar phosphate isomerase/epimerase
MSLSYPSLEKIPVCYASCSIGSRDEDTLPKKLDAISKAGFQAIELAMPDLQSFATLHLGHDVGVYDFDDLCAAAKVVRSMCEAKGLKILILQPFSNFEGWEEGSEERIDAFTRVSGWIEVMKSCGTDMIQVLTITAPEIKNADIGHRLARQILRRRRLAQTAIDS